MIMFELLLLWILVTLGSAVGLLAFLAFDEWQVRSNATRPKSARHDAAPAVNIAQAA